jgi:hypothetical protein
VLDVNTGDLLGKIFERGNALQTFWGFYITIALALIGFFGARSDRRARPHAAVDARERWLLPTFMTVGFVGFAIVNGSGIYAIAQQRQVLFRLLEAQTQTSPRTLNRASNLEPCMSRTLDPSIDLQRCVLDMTEPYQAWKYPAFHIGADITVLAAVWYLALRRH